MTLNRKPRRRFSPDARSEHILIAAIRLSIQVGYKSITRDQVAAEAEVSSALIAKYYPKMYDLKRAVMDAAIGREVVEIIAQGITLGDIHALKIPPTLKSKVMSYLTDK